MISQRFRSLLTWGGKRFSVNARPGLSPRRGIVGVFALVLMSLTLTPALARTTVILALGDSLTAGYNLPQGAGFAPRLETALKAAGHDVRVIDGGVSGDTTGDGLARLDWMLSGDHPDVAVVELGANDALRGMPTANAEANLDAIVTALQTAKVRVLIAGMKAPPNLGAAYGTAFAAIYTDVAAKHKVALYPFFLAPVAANPAYLLSDGLHPTPEGVDRIVAGILPSVIAVLPDGNSQP